MIVMKAEDVMRRDEIMLRCGDGRDWEGGEARTMVTLCYLLFSRLWAKLRRKEMSGYRGDLELFVALSRSEAG